MTVAKDNSISDLWPQTCCNGCQTVFEVPPELLASSDTRVRCGECLSIFDALEGVQRQNASLAEGQTVDLLDAHGFTPGDEVQARNEQEEFSNLDVTYSDFDLFSDEADLPEVRYQEEERNPGVDFNFDAVEIENDQTFSDTLFNNDVTINADLPTGQLPLADVAGKPGSNLAIGQLDRQAAVDFSAPPVSGSSAPLVFEYHDPNEEADDDARTSHELDPTLLDDHLQIPRGTASPNAWGWFKVLLGCCVLLVFLAALYLYRERGTLYNNPDIRPVYVNFCKLASCQVPLPFDPLQMSLVRRDIYPHPSIPDALVINVVVKNQASFAQRYPVLNIRLEQNNGTALAIRDFPPEDYLDAGAWRESSVINAGASVSITLEIQDPGDKASSFTLKFL